MKISPSIGRIVWYWRDAPLRAKDAQPEAGIVVFVHNDSLVNLCVFDKAGVPCSVERVVLRQPDEVETPHVPHCEWMPYQIGQANKQAAAPQGEGTNYLSSQTQPGADANRVVSPTPSPNPPDPVPDPPGKRTGGK